MSPVLGYGVGGSLDVFRSGFLQRCATDASLTSGGAVVSVCAGKMTDRTRRTASVPALGMR